MIDFKNVKFIFSFFFNFSLLPHRSNSIDGKKHVRTVPVRLRKAQNDEHSKHEGLHFENYLSIKVFFFFFRVIRWTFCNSDNSLYQRFSWYIW